jgi:hypothetical protein
MNKHLKKIIIKCVLLEEAKDGTPGEVCNCASCNKDVFLDYAIKAKAIEESKEFGTIAEKDIIPFCYECAKDKAKINFAAKDIVKKEIEDFSSSLEEGIRIDDLKKLKPENPREIVIKNVMMKKLEMENAGYDYIKDIQEYTDIFYKENKIHV